MVHANRVGKPGRPRFPRAAASDLRL